MSSTDETLAAEVYEQILRESGEDVAKQILGEHFASSKETVPEEYAGSHKTSESNSSIGSSSARETSTYEIMSTTTDVSKATAFEFEQSDTLLAQPASQESIARSKKIIFGVGASAIGIVAIIIVFAIVLRKLRKARQKDLEACIVQTEPVVLTEKMAAAESVISRPAYHGPPQAGPVDQKLAKN